MEYNFARKARFDVKSNMLISGGTQISIFFEKVSLERIPEMMNIIFKIYEMIVDLPVNLLTSWCMDRHETSSLDTNGVNGVASRMPASM